MNRKIWRVCIIIGIILLMQTKVYAVSEKNDVEKQTEIAEQTEVSGQLKLFADQYDYGDIDETLKQLFPGERLDFKEILLGVISGDITFSTELLNRLIKEQFTYAFSSSRENMIHILALAIIAAVFTNFAGVFGNNQVADAGFYVLYLMIVALCLNSAQNVMEWVEEGMNALTSFMTVFCPVYFPAVAVAKGSVTAVSFYSLTLFLVYLVEMFVQYMLLPVIHIYIMVSMLNYVTREAYLSKLSELLGTVLIWTMKTILAGIAGLNLIQSLLSPAIDTVKRSALTKGAKVIPGIGDAIGGVTEVIFASAVLIKNGIGVAGAIFCFALCVLPIVQITAIVLLYKIAAAFIQPVADARIVGCMETVENGMLLLLRAVFTIGLLFLITIILVAASTGAS